MKNLRGHYWVNFVTDLIAYAFVRVSLSDAKFMAGEYLNESHNMIYSD